MLLCTAAATVINSPLFSADIEQTGGGRVSNGAEGGNGIRSEGGGGGEESRALNNEG